MPKQASILFHKVDLDFEFKDEAHLRDWLSRIAAEEGCFIAKLTYNFCSDEHLLVMNQRHLDHDFYTDVITFDDSRLPLIKGDVFISIDRVSDNAKERKSAFIAELYRVMAHGLLHLMGYGDKSEEEIAVMRAKEDWALRLVH